MKLFIWEPQGHGQVTLTVVAEDLVQAQKLADQHVEVESRKNSYSYSGWGTDYYKLEVHEAGVVVEHAND